MWSSLFSQGWFNALYFNMRWLHVFFGIVWIGHLYYFNFVQGAFMAEVDATVKSQATQKLVPRALWWFRWGAMGTFLTGVIILGAKGHVDASNGALVLASPYWINILTGALLATLMFLNVWLVIWPKQKIVIANAVATASGQQANPAAAGAAARALVASRTNVLFSVTMLFFMLASAHVGYAVTEASQVTLYWVALIVIVGALQANALFGKAGPLTTIKGVITCAFGLLIVITGLLSALV